MSEQGWQEFPESGRVDEWVVLHGAHVSVQSQSGPNCHHERDACLAASAVASPTTIMRGPPYRRLQSSLGNKPAASIADGLADEAVEFSGGVFATMRRSSSLKRPGGH